MKQHRLGSLAFALAVGLVVVVGLLAVGSGPAAAQAPDAATEDEMYRIADKLNCPICQGQRLSECPIQICQEMRAEIVQRLQAGQPEEEIIQAFIDRYGIQVLNQPPVEGFNLLAWVIPFVGLGLALIVGAWVLRQWLQRRPVAGGESVESGVGDLPEEYLRRLEEEVASDQ